MYRRRSYKNSFTGRLLQEYFRQQRSRYDNRNPFLLASHAAAQAATINDVAATTETYFENCDPIWQNPPSDTLTEAPLAFKMVVKLRLQSREEDLWRKCPMVGFVRSSHNSYMTLRYMSVHARTISLKIRSQQVRISRREPRTCDVTKCLSSVCTRMYMGNRYHRLKWHRTSDWIYSVNGCWWQTSGGMVNVTKSKKGIYTV